MALGKIHSIKISDDQSLEWGPPASEEGELSSEDLDRLAHWLDTVFEIPGLKLRFGLDALLGLVPGVGDTASALASVYILNAAMRLGISRITLARMTLNILVDLMIGAIPLAGDIFDVYWKANRRNVDLLQKHLRSNPAIERKLRWSDGLFVAAMIGTIVTVLVASLIGAYFILSWVMGLLSRG